ncbi:unnamed protein product [Durusdinium trenchii]|uniref:Poly [ADP-ribose] polymerase n=1 Tax=Durusdinium trenchii TaxID=1381693 RepID=A0ABP0JNN5_9DINO
MAWADCGSSIYYRTANNLHYTAQPYGAGEGLCTRPSKGEMASNLPEKYFPREQGLDEYSNNMRCYMQRSNVTGSISAQGPTMNQPRSLTVRYEGEFSTASLAVALAKLLLLPLHTVQLQRSRRLSTRRVQTLSERCDYSIQFLDSTGTLHKSVEATLKVLQSDPGQLNMPLLFNLQIAITDMTEMQREIIPKLAFEELAYVPQRQTCLKEIVASLDLELNEAYLWHGTQVRTGLQIAQESSAIEKYLSGVSDSTLGDRASAVGTYREFVVYHPDQVYPEYLVLYERLHGTRPPEPPPKDMPFLLELPLYWKNVGKNPFAKRVYLHDPTGFSDPMPWIGAAWGGNRPTRNQVQRVKRVEDSVLWCKYMNWKKQLSQELSKRKIDRCKPPNELDGNPNSGHVLTGEIQAEHDGDEAISLENMVPGLNELLLWHGTSREAAAAIASDGTLGGRFILNPSALHGRRFGNGVYLAEDLRKSMSYCKESEGVLHVLLCRAVCGEIFYTEKDRHVDAPDEAKAAKKQSVLANPGKVGPREYILFETAQVYPEYIVEFALSPWTGRAAGALRRRLPAWSRRVDIRTFSKKKKPVALETVVPRDGSRDDLKILPSDPEGLKLKVRSLGSITLEDQNRFVQKVNDHGAAVLVPEEEGDPLAVYKTLDRWFGNCIPHDAMNEHGIVEINPANPTSINTANPKKEHLPHTDDAYTDSPAAFCTLQCRTSAATGGESVLVSGAELLAALSNEELRTLMQPGMVSMGRRPAADGSWMKVRWRCNDGCVGDVAAEVKPSYEQMDAVARHEVHQLVVPLNPGELLIVDNRAIAHGRRPYESDDPRIMWRKNYVGNGELEAQLRTGMCAAFSSMFDGLHSMFDPMSLDTSKLKI